MNSARATVSKILNFSCVDGPGNRLVIFLQGCNFNCEACHNPHTIGVCDNCGDCIPACHVDALSLVHGKIEFDAELCDQCDACLEVCPIDANPMVREYSVDEILEIVRRRQSFLTGITVSGGEPTMQLGFLVELFAAIKADPALSSLTCFIDSNGNLGKNGWHKLLPVTDGVMLDIKAFDPSLHREIVGSDGHRSQRAARLIHDAGKLYELRYLLVPGRTDTDSELSQLADFVIGLDPNIRVKLNAFQHHGVRDAARKWQPATEEVVDEVATRLRSSGVGNVVTPAVYI